MSPMTTGRWATMRTTASRRVEDVLRTVFPKSDAYQYNSAVIRVRVIDPRFDAMKHDDRHDQIDALLSQLPEDIELQIMTVLALPADPAKWKMSERHRNEDFENPEPFEL